jgi:hypothetical protein
MTGMSSRVATNHAQQIEFESSAAYADPPSEVELDVIFRGPDGREQRVPAFWAGGTRWAVRFSSPTPGAFTWRSVCTNAGDQGLHGVEGGLDVTPYEGDNALLKHGPLRPSANGRYLEHFDGTPFFWLGDTWWMGLCGRLKWPHDWVCLGEDRVYKRFSVIQIVAGLYPDMAAFDPRGDNDAGWPWTPGFAQLNPAYFDAADTRINWLAKHNLVPCIVGCWAYYLPWMGIAKMKQHWRYLVARWGALPVVWCLAGEGSMPYYLSEDRDGDIAQQRQGWTELARYVHTIDPFARPVSIHPTDIGRQQVDDPAVLDFDMLQTGHSDRASLPNTLRCVTTSYAAAPTMPVINSEVCYEGIGESCRQEVVRLMYWSSFLSGACGFTYGANGLWQLNRKDAPYGPSPHGMSWGGPTWEEAMVLPGSEQLSLARRILEQFPWWRFAPHPEWISPHATVENPAQAVAGGVEGEVRLFYLPANLVWSPPTFRSLPPDAPFVAKLISPVDGQEWDLGRHTADVDGDWRLSQRVPIYQDWLLAIRHLPGN